MSIMEKYQKSTAFTLPNGTKENAIKTRLGLDNYNDFIDCLDKDRKGKTKAARLFANMPEILALGMTAYCVRNTCLEDFHAENTPIDDEKMKIFMKECSEKCSEVLSNLLSSDYMTRATMSYFLMSQCEFYCKEWDIPDVVNPSYLENER